MNGFLERAEDRMREKRIAEKKDLSKSSVKPKLRLFQDDLNFPDETLENALDAIIQGKNISQSISAITTKCKKLAAGSRKQQREQISIVYSIALTLKNNPGVYANFCQNLSWKEYGLKSNPDPKNLKKALELVLKIVIYPQHKDDQKQLSVFRRALGRSFLEDRSIQEVNQLLDAHGGLYGLAGFNGKSKKQTTSASKSTYEADDEFSGSTLGDNSADDVIFKDTKVGDVDSGNSVESDSKETEDNLDFLDRKPQISLYVKLAVKDLKLLGSSLKQAWLGLNIADQMGDFDNNSIKLAAITLADPTKLHSKR